MIGFFLCLVAFACTYIAARQSLGAGLQALVIVGYSYGLFRGRYPDGLTHFTFDAALLALYLAYFSQRVTLAMEARSSEATAWMRALMLWPLVCMAYSPLLPNAQPLVVQLVGLRGAVLMLPCLVIGARMQRSDFDRLAPTLAILNVIALFFTAIEFVYGIEAVVPENIATTMIYVCNDVRSAGELYHRIPSIFINAHAYGGTMLISGPFLVHGLESKQRWTRLLCTAGLIAAGAGILASAARTPVVIMGFVTVYVLIKARVRFGALVTVALVGACLFYLVAHSERFQRFETLTDTDYVEGRVTGSVNSSFVDLLVAYPLGAGLAGAFGTSIPFFMSKLAHPTIGIENEYGHLLVEQGIVGFVLWVGLVVRLVTRTGVPVASPIATSFAVALIFATWGTALLGVGTLSSIPSSALFLCFCGMHIAVGPREKAQLALRHVTRGHREPLPSPTRPGATVSGRVVTKVG